MKVYKFTNEKFTDDLAVGRVWVSAAHTFRGADGIDDGRSDAHELVATAIPKGGQETLDSSHPFLSDLIHMYDERGNRIHAEFVVTGAQVQKINNGLIYCVSSELSDGIRDQMARKFDARAVFEIADVNAFADILGRDPNLVSRTLRHGRVEYRDS